jgi:hypothetical protein
LFESRVNEKKYFGLHNLTVLSANLLLRAGLNSVKAKRKDESNYVVEQPVRSAAANAPAGTAVGYNTTVKKHKGFGGS